MDRRTDGLQHLMRPASEGRTITSKLLCLF